jgi:glutamine synthetase
MANYGDKTHDAIANNAVNGEIAESPIDRIAKLLTGDKKVKVAGIDCDGILRGKIIHKTKFLSSLESGFGMSSAIFGWDMHDVLYTEETGLTSADSGYQDFTAVIDLNSFRRLPFEDNIAFFLLHFYIQDKPVFADGRGLVKALTNNLADSGYKGLAGGESTPTCTDQYEWTKADFLILGGSGDRIPELSDTVTRWLQQLGRPTKPRGVPRQ